MSLTPIERAAIHSILNETGLGREWTVQGFGMIRTYLDEKKRWRLNVWDDRLRVSDVTVIHDHPWSFTSWIFCGALRNQRYEFERTDRCPTHKWMRIETGEAGGPKSPVATCVLKPKGLEVYWPGDTYRQLNNEVHETIVQRGTVTLNDRSEPSEDHSARVFWRTYDKWVDAKPRPATTHEVCMAIQAAMDIWG